MRKVCLILLTAVIFSACSKDDPIIEGDLTGTWILIEQLADPGNGSGTFQPVDSDKTITFLENNQFFSNGNLCQTFQDVKGGSSGSYDPVSKTLLVSDCVLIDSSRSLMYEIQGNNLIIHYLCIEPCAEKYQRIQ